MVLVGIIIFSLSQPTTMVAVVKTQQVTWYNAEETLLGGEERSFSKWLKEDDVLHIFVNVTYSTEKTNRLIRVLVSDEEGNTLINQTLGTLNTSLVVKRSQMHTVVLDNTFDEDNDKRVYLTLTIEREVVTMEERQSSLPVTGFAIFMVGAALFLVGCFVKVPKKRGGAS